MTPKEESALWLRHNVHFQGKDDPTRVPLRIRLSFVVKRIAEGYRDPRLDAADIEHLRKWEDKLTPAITAAYVSEVPALAETGDPEELARLVTELEQKDHDERERLCREFLDKLTPEGQSVILGMISAVTPNFSTIDFIGMAAEAPEYFRQMILENCNSLLSGPPEEPVIWNEEEHVKVRPFSTDPIPGILKGSK